MARTVRRRRIALPWGLLARLVWHLAILGGIVFGSVKLVSIDRNISDLTDATQMQTAMMIQAARAAGHHPPSSE